MLILARQRRTVAAKAIGNQSTSQTMRVHPANVCICHRGRSGEEMQDTDYSFANARRHSNSSTQGLSDFNTKFEAFEPEPVFEEEDLGEADIVAGNDNTVTKVESASSNDSEADRDRRKY